MAVDHHALPVRFAGATDTVRSLLERQIIMSTTYLILAKRVALGGLTSIEGTTLQFIES